MGGHRQNTASEFDEICSPAVCHVTRRENFPYSEKARLHPVATVEEALRVAHAHCTASRPRIMVMPQGANTLPLIKKPSCL